MTFDDVPTTPEAERSLPGFRPVGLDTEVASFMFDTVLALDGGDLLALNPGVVESGPQAGLRCRTWRNSGPRLRLRARPVPPFATIAALGLERGLRVTRAFLTGDATWPGRSPMFRIDGVLHPPDAVAALLPSADANRDAAVARVADVRALYGRMLTDIAYRIENAALFDSAVPTTRAFETALVLWSDVTAATPSADVLRRAGVVKVTFDTARAHAETVGLAHLPDQAVDQARRAAAAARLARKGATPAERAVAQEQVIRILRSLALYYLPDPDRLPAALTSRASRALGA